MYKNVDYIIVKQLLLYIILHIQSYSNKRDDSILFDKSLIIVLCRFLL